MKILNSFIFIFWLWYIYNLSNKKCVYIIKKRAYVYIHVRENCLDKYISIALDPPRQKFLTPPLSLFSIIWVCRSLYSLLFGFVNLLFGFVDLFFRFVVVDLLNCWFYFLGLCLIFEFLVEIKANPSSTRAQYHLTGGFSWSAASLELLHLIWSGRLWVGHKSNPDRPMYRPNYNIVHQKKKKKVLNSQQPVTCSIMNLEKNFMDWDKAMESNRNPSVYSFAEYWKSSQSSHGTISTLPRSATDRIINAMNLHLTTKSVYICTVRIT